MNAVLKSNGIVTRGTTPATNTVLASHGVRTGGSYALRGNAVLASHQCSEMGTGGHYMQLDYADAWGDVATRIGECPELSGIILRKHWHALESSEGVYTLTDVRGKLDDLAALGKKLILMLVDRSFAAAETGTDSGHVAPAYLRATAGTAAYRIELETGAVPDTTGGYTMQRWSTVYRTRMKALIDAVCTEFDGHAAFEGVALQETSLGLAYYTSGGSPPDGDVYSAQKYEDALEDVISNTVGSRPNSWLFWYQNFLSGGNSRLDTVCDTVKAARVIFGGPDIRPDDQSLRDNVYGDRYPTAVNNGMPIFCSNQATSHYTQRAVHTTYTDAYSAAPDPRLWTQARDNFTANASTNELTVSLNFGWIDNETVMLMTNGTLPAPLEAGVAYYVDVVSTYVIKLRAVDSRCVGTALIDITSAGTGTHTIRREAWTNFAVNTSTDYITLTDDLELTEGQRLMVQTAGTLAAPLTTGSGVWYYAKNISGTTLQLSLTLGGAAVNLTTTGTGTQCIGRAFWTMKELYEWARANLHISYCMWNEIDGVRGGGGGIGNEFVFEDDEVVISANEEIQ